MTRSRTHTGVAAVWCDICGQCSCPRDEDGYPVTVEDDSDPVWVGGFPMHTTVRVLDPECPLHGDASEHVPAELSQLPQD